MSSEQSLLFLVAGITMLLVYFIPSLIAGSRKHESLGWIIFLNLFFAWTGILWVVLILWAGLGNTRRES